MDEGILSCMQRADILSTHGCMLDKAVDYMIEVLETSPVIDCKCLDLADQVFKSSVRPFRNLMKSSQNPEPGKPYPAALERSQKRFGDLTGRIVEALENVTEKLKDDESKSLCFGTKADIVRYQCEYACALGEVEDDVFQDCENAYMDAIECAKAFPETRFEVERNYCCFLWNCTDDKQKAVDLMQKTVDEYGNRKLSSRAQDALEDYKAQLSRFKEVIGC